MALSAERIEDLARRLDDAERTRVQLPQFSAEHPGMTVDDSYAVQRAWVAAKLARGRSVIGQKIGLTSRAMQRSSNIDEPDYGVLLDDMLFADGAEIPIARFITPRVEVELAFILKSELRGPDVTLADVLNATDHVTPALEIIDARIERVDKSGVTRKVFDTIADNAANAGLVLGGRSVPPDAVDLKWVGALLYRNGSIEETGLAAGVLGHPGLGVAWLANRLATYGEVLEAGAIILAGSFTAPVDASAGDAFQADYGPLGSIAIRFT